MSNKRKAETPGLLVTHPGEITEKSKIYLDNEKDRVMTAFQFLDGNAKMIANTLSIKLIKSELKGVAHPDPPLIPALAWDATLGANQAERTFIHTIPQEH